MKRRGGEGAEWGWLVNLEKKREKIAELGSVPEH